MIDKMIQAKKGGIEEDVKLCIYVDNCTRDFLPPKKKCIEVLESMTLTVLKGMIREKLNLNEEEI